MLFAAVTDTPTDDVTRWLSVNALLIFVFALGVFLVWHFARPIARRVAGRVLEARERAAPGSIPMEELQRRANTLERLVDRLVRALLIGSVVVVVLGQFDLWPALAGLSLVLAALTVAGQSVVLDYIMGVLILVEGQYYIGDTVRLGSTEGEVEEVGLRRTVVRDAAGIVHSVSNGIIRTSANLTRIYAVAIVDIQGVRNEDVDTVIALMDQVGRAMAHDPLWTESIVDPPAYSGTIAFTDLGATLRMTSRVQPSARGTVPAELRRRLAVAMAAAGIHLLRRAGHPGDPDAPPPSPPAGPNPVLMP